MRFGEIPAKKCEKEKEKAEGFPFSLLTVVLKRHHGSVGVKVSGSNQLLLRRYLVVFTLSAVRPFPGYGKLDIGSVTCTTTSVRTVHSRDTTSPCTRRRDRSWRVCVRLT